MTGRSRRPTETIEFGPADVSGVVDRMDRLAAAGDGWVNFLPGMPEGEAEQPSRGFLGALFSATQAPASMATWMPAGGARRSTASGSEQTVGLLHPRGRAAVARLASAGVAVPAGWRVGQDHARRGLIVHPPSGAPPGDVVSWTLRAGEALAAGPLTGRWQARVYLPLSRSTTS